MVEGVECLIGGNLDLCFEMCMVCDFNLFWDLLKDYDVMFNLVYIEIDIEDVILVFLGLIFEIEVVFLDWVLCDVSGVLIQIDVWFINIVELIKCEISYGFNWLIQLLCFECLDFELEERW